MINFKNLFKSLLILTVFAGAIYYSIGVIQDRQNIMSFEDYEPISSLVVEENLTKKAKFPFIDVHSHLWDMPVRDLDKLVGEMDDLNMAYIVNLSGSGFGPQAVKDLYLSNSLENINENQPGRIGLFVNVDFSTVDNAKDVEAQANIIRDAVAKGAIGLKVYKSLGLRDKDSQGNRVAVDDPRLGPIWDACGELGIPVLIHSADPFPFWQAKNEKNERWYELKEKPNRFYGESDFIPPFEDIIEEQHRMFKRHPNTTFINAHLGWLAHDLERLGKHLDEHSNVVTEFGAVIAELGRQPIAARNFMIKYQDRIMFGKDTYKKEEYFLYFRVLETNDEYFNYFRKRHAFWKMYGLGLPDEVLKKIYYENALKLFPSISKKLISR